MKKYIIILYVVMNQSLLYSQNESVEKLNIKSPEVSAYQKYGEIPVSTYTGVPNVSIPILNVKSGDLELPITLDYHATAIKVDQEATWVGLNWLLNAGGVIGTKISRTHMGVTEWDKLFNKMSYVDTRSGDFAITGQMVKFAGTHEQYSSSRYSKNLFSGLSQSPADNEITRASYAELKQYGFGGAKEFSANFCGYSFNFIYHPIQQKLIVVGQDNKFILQQTASGGPEPYYILTAPNGVKYSFAETETTTYLGGSVSGAPLILVSYYLTKIESPSGRTISLRYKKYGGTFPIIKATETVYHGYKRLSGMTALDDEFLDGKVHRKLSQEHYIDNIYLYEIESDDALVRFNVGSRVDIKGSPKKLDSIEIFDKLNGNKKIKSFAFAYDYYTGNNVGGEYIYDYYKYIYEGRTFDSSSIKFTGDHLNKRLRLLSVTEEGYNAAGTKTVSAPYKFTYNSGSLPGKTSAARDYWGNYNGKENSGGKYYHTLLPDVTYLGENTQQGYPADFNTKFVKADRRLNPSVIATGLMSRITYPTGGYSDFLFEPHKVNNYPYSLASSTETWSATKSVSCRKTNFDTSIPIDILTPKEFILTQVASVTVRIDFNNPSSYDWKEMTNKPMYLMKYTTIKNSTTGRITETFSPLKTYILSDLTGLSTSVSGKVISETITLQPGKYRIQAGFSFPQIGAYDATTKGSRSIVMTVSHASLDLLSEYKFSTVYKYTRKTDTDFMLPEKELTIKEFIIKEETGIECNVSIETNGKYPWSAMQGSKAYLYKYVATRNSDGSVSEQVSPVKQWGVDDLSLTTDGTIRKKTELVILEPGKYRMKTELSVPEFPVNTSEYINSGGAKILMNIKKYSNTVTGETTADAVGVRIAQISSYDGTKTNVVKYKYLDTGTPSGIMMSPLKFTRKKYQIYQPNSEQAVSTASGIDCSSPSTARLVNYWFYSSENLIQGSGSNIGYGYVEVVREGSGYESFSYWNKRNFSKDYLNTLPDPRNGKLLEHGIYNQSGALLKKINNIYTILKTETYFVNAVLEDIYMGPDNVSQCNSLINPYYAACPHGRAFIQIYPSIKTWLEKTSSSEEQYFPQGTVLTQNIYTYNPLNLSLASEQEIIDSSESRTQYYIYPNDYSTNNTTYPGTLIAKNILNRPLEIINTIKKSNGLFILSGVINKYNDRGKIISVSNLEFAGILPLSNFKFSNKTSTGILGTANESSGSYSPYSGYVERIQTGYTPKGNLRNIYKDNVENTVYIWGYNSQYPIAEIQNITYEKVRDELGGEIAVNNIENRLAPSDSEWTLLNNLQSKQTLKNAQVKIYTYKPLMGVLSVTDPRGVITKYEYDAFGRLQLTKDNTDKVLQRYYYNYKNQ